MTLTPEALRAELIDKVAQHIEDNLPQKQAMLLEPFMRGFYSSAPPEDIISKTVIDLYGAIVSLWHCVDPRKPKKPKINVYNPQFEQHGWQTTHTVIEIVSDDMPFLVESVRLAINRRGLAVHLILHLGGIQFARGDDGHIQKVLSCEGEACERGTPEAAILLEVDRQSEATILESLRKGIALVLDDVHLCVQDWQAMTRKMSSLINLLPKMASKEKKEAQAEKIEFLKWINDNHFTYLGYCQVDYVKTNGEKEWQVVKGSALGVFRRSIQDVFQPFSALSERAQKKALSSDVILLGKANTPATVHRPAYPDFISVKIFDEKGKVVGEHRFIGLYTAAAYNWSVANIPLLRDRVQKVIERADVPPNGHDAKTLLNILETLPRDELFQATDDELFALAKGVLHLQDRQRVRVFIRKDQFGKFYSCLVYVPRDKFHSQLRQDMQEILKQELNAVSVEFTTHFSESVLARIYFIARLARYEPVEYDAAHLQQSMIEATRTWQDNFREALIEQYGEERGNQLFEDFGDAFPAGYREEFVSRTAVFDVGHIENLTNGSSLEMSFYRPLEEAEGTLRFKLYHPNKSIPLSDVIPMLECMGLRVISERPYEIRCRRGKFFWVNDFGMFHASGEELNVDKIKDTFQDAFYNIWLGRAESDGFNRLVLDAGLNWREVTMLRAYAKYMWQIGFSFSQAYIENALADNAKIAKILVELFLLRFDPTREVQDKKAQCEHLRKKVKAELEKVSSLDEDRILRRYLDVMSATLRTNYFQTDESGQPKAYLSFKVETKNIPEVPLPHPLFEIFVYSPLVEGVHLRGGKVARGGIRWSDRREDFRTEVLGLMKAQQVKNAVIVPMGAKGGFVPKALPVEASREQVLAEVIQCYQIFIRGLLDLTDNLVGDNVVVPNNVVRYDEDDPYLVVAADKGTASFSDIANAISQEYGFWLGDAFASGGSAGYDHKKMGITARGAWESVKRHFREIGVDTQSSPITVVGIGDMSGDVFGNGMLLSEQIRLVGAFNHIHIFLDPDPDPKVSFEERLRLFQSSRSSWMDYNKNLLSKGGGIYARSAKSIQLSKEVQQLLGVQKEHMVPNELIRALLTAEVDLLWNGGIGTYVKASSEHNMEVGDRANDALRINGNDLRCKVVGEGGNLGFTQLGRIEYALKSGRLNTDAIDNSGGVDCSDHEVNIKILLNDVVANGDMTEKQRNALLATMTEEVAELVLDNNRGQTGVISEAMMLAANNLEMHARLIQYLEKKANLDRELEFLPSKEDFLTRKQNQQGLTRPEFSVILAYGKTLLKEELLASNLPEDPYVEKMLMTAFPEVLREKLKPYMEKHRLRREIIAMQLGNSVVNDMGVAFVNRLEEETGATAPEIIRCYIVAREIFKARQFREAINALDFIVEAEVQTKMLRELNRLVRRSTRWFLRHRRLGFDIESMIELFSPMIHQVREEVPKVVKGAAKDFLAKLEEELKFSGVPDEMAYRAATMPAMFPALDIVEAVRENQFDLVDFLGVYHGVGACLELGWMREQIKQHTVTSHWEAMARAAFRDDLDRQQRSLAESIMKTKVALETVDAKIEAWKARHDVLIARWQQMLQDLKSTAIQEFTMYSVALRELLDLAQCTLLELTMQESEE